MCGLMHTLTREAAVSYMRLDASISAASDTCVVRSQQRAFKSWQRADRAFQIRKCLKMKLLHLSCSPDTHELVEPYC